MKCANGLVDIMGKGNTNTINILKTNFISKVWKNFHGKLFYCLYHIY